MFYILTHVCLVRKFKLFGALQMWILLKVAHFRFLKAKSHIRKGMIISTEKCLIAGPKVFGDKASCIGCHCNLESLGYDYSHITSDYFLLNSSFYSKEPTVPYVPGLCAVKNVRNYKIMKF